MTAAELVLELTRRGARIELAGSRVLVRPRSAVLDLEPMLRARARELRALAVVASENETHGTHTQNTQNPAVPSAGGGFVRFVYASGESVLSQPLGPDVSTWPPGPHARWAARAAALEVLEGLSATEADRRAADEIRRETEADPSPPWLWVSSAEGPFSIAGDPPPSAELPDLVAEALAAVAAMNRAFPHDDAACERAARRLEEGLAELRREGVRAWLVS